MTRLEVAHTARLGREALRAARALLDDVFAGELEEEDWEHCLGGLHALVWDGEELLAHAALVQRRLLHDGRALRAGYVEGVGVRADARRRGHGAAVVGALGEVVAEAYDLGALGTTDEAVPLYTGLGWLPWRGPLSALTPDGLRPTPDEQGGVYVLPAACPLDLDGPLACDWRDGDVW